MEQPPTDESENPQPQFIFGPLGRGYRLSKRQRRIVDVLGLGFVLPVTALVALAKYKFISIGLGYVFGGFAAGLIAAFVVMKIYVTAASIPYVPRRWKGD